VAAMERENRQLHAQLARLHQQSTIIEQARLLGMVRSGEQGFFTTGLPNN